MIKEDAIIKEYIEADSELRLALFLCHTRLRNRFIDVDLYEKRIPGRRKKRQRKMLLERFSGDNCEQ